MAPPPLDLLAALLAGAPVPALDVGAAGGMNATWQPYARWLSVDAFEPDEEECARQQAASPGINWFPVALAGTTGPRPFYVLNRSTGSSLYPPNAEVLGRYATTAYHGVRTVREVECSSLADFLDRYERPVPRLLKLDTQGSELEILRSLRDEQWEQVLWIETEVEFAELYEDQPLFCDVNAELTARGFELLDLRTHRAYHVAGEVENGHLRRELRAAVGSPRLSARLVAGDALYARPLDHPSVTGSRQAMAAYLLAALVYKYHDLAFELLARPSARTLFDEPEIESLRRDVRRTSPRPRPWERAGAPFDLARKVRAKLLPGTVGRQVFWTRRTWPDQ